MEYIEKIITPYKKIMSQAADVIVTEDVSRYPIFIMFQSEINAGIAVVNKQEDGGDWNIHASTLEEFYAKKLIEAEKIDDFRILYKKHETELCIFVLSEDGANFVFIPA
jgi:hypothetical protein